MIKIATSAGLGLTVLVAVWALLVVLMVTLTLVKLAAGDQSRARKMRQGTRRASLSRD